MSAQDTLIGSDDDTLTVEPARRSHNRDPDDHGLPPCGYDGCTFDAAMLVDTGTHVLLSCRVHARDEWLLLLDGEGER